MLDTRYATAAFIEAALNASPRSCILWPFGLQHGRPVMRNGGGRRARVANYVCRRVYGPPPPGRPQAAHLCADELCIHPGHLRWSSNADNKLDNFIRQMTAADFAALRQFPQDTPLARRLRDYPAYLLPKQAAPLRV